MDIEREIRKYLTTVIHMSLGTSRNDKPWVCEVHFVYDDDLNLYFRSLTSRRHSQEIAANPNVAGNIVRQHGPGESPHGIYFEGTAKLLDDETERQNIFPQFQKAGVTERALEEARTDKGSQFYKIAVTNWYAFGKFGGDSTQKYELHWYGGKK